MRSDRRGHGHRVGREHERLRPRERRRGHDVPLPHDRRGGVRLRPPRGVPCDQPLRHEPEICRRAATGRHRAVHPLLARRAARGGVMRIAVPDLISNSYFPAIAAAELGFFKAEGLDIDRVELLFPVPKLMEALRDGALDFVAGSAHATLMAFTDWRGAKLLAALAQRMYWLLAPRAAAARRGRAFAWAPRPESTSGSSGCCSKPASIPSATACTSRRSPAQPARRSLSACPRRNRSGKARSTGSRG